MSSLFKNKKGKIGEAMQEMVGTFIVAMVIIFFFLSSVMFGLPSFKIERISSDINEQIQDHYFIQSKLYEKLDFDYDEINHEMDGADLVKITEIDESAKTLLIAQGLSLDIDVLEGFYIPFADDKIYVSKEKEQNE